MILALFLVRSEASGQMPDDLSPESRFSHLTSYDSAAGDDFGMFNEEYFGAPSSQDAFMASIEEGESEESLISCLLDLVTPPCNLL